MPCATNSYHKLLIKRCYADVSNSRSLRSPKLDPSNLTKLNLIVICFGKDHALVHSHSVRPSLSFKPTLTLKILHLHFLIGSKVLSTFWICRYPKIDLLTKSFHTKHWEQGSDPVPCYCLDLGFFSSHSIQNHELSKSKVLIWDSHLFNIEDTVCFSPIRSRACHRH